MSWRLLLLGHLSATPLAPLYAWLRRSYLWTTCDFGVDDEGIDCPENGLRFSFSSRTALPFCLRACVNCAVISVGLVSSSWRERACVVLLCGVDGGRPRSED